MSYGKDERHIDKYVWMLPIPLFDPSIESHSALADLGAQAEAEIAELDLAEDTYFVGLRQNIRRHLAASDVGREIEERVEELIG